MGKGLEEEEEEEDKVRRRSWSRGPERVWRIYKKEVFGKVWRQQEEVPGFTEEAGLSGSVVRSDTRGPL